MVLMESCLCCSLALAGAVIGVYLLVAYIIAFMVEIWFILDTTVTIPTPAYILPFLYLIQFVCSAILLHGLSVARNVFLLVWLFMMGLLVVPEGCLVLYMGVYHWTISNLYGLIETTSWICRLLVSLVGAVCLQSLYFKWREEKTIARHLMALKTGTFGAGTNSGLSQSSIPYDYETKLSYQNQGYITSTEHLKRYHYPLDNSDEIHADTESRYVEGLNLSTMFTTSQSEFNASNFNARLKNFPYLTMQRSCSRERLSFHRYSHKPMINLNDPLGYVEDDQNNPIPNKSRSLIDLREPDTNNALGKNKKKLSKSISLNYINYLGLKRDEQTKTENIQTLSLDRKLLRNNFLPQLKNLTKLPALLNKKVLSDSEDKINTYRVNPPKKIFTNNKKTCKIVLTDYENLNLDGQLNKIYSLRGMYVYDEKFRKINYYPPQYFNKEEFNTKMNIFTCSSSLSGNSVSCGSDDVRHISDFAL